MMGWLRALFDFGTAVADAADVPDEVTTSRRIAVIGSRAGKIHKRLSKLWPEHTRGYGHPKPSPEVQALLIRLRALDAAARALGAEAGLTDWVAFPGEDLIAVSLTLTHRQVVAPVIPEAPLGSAKWRNLYLLACADLIRRGETPATLDFVLPWLLDDSAAARVVRAQIVERASNNLTRIVVYVSASDAVSEVQVFHAVQASTDIGHRNVSLEVSTNDWQSTRLVVGAPGNPEDEVDVRVLPPEWVRALGDLPTVWPPSPCVAALPDVPVAAESSERPDDDLPEVPLGG